MNRINKNTSFIKWKAQELGFGQCGIAKAEFLEDDAPFLERWLSNNMHGEMAYMANHFDKRLDPRKLVPGAKSVVTLLYNYYPKEDLSRVGRYKIAKYAYGKDYHFVIKDKLKDFYNAIEENIGKVEGRVFVDSAPVMERQWAQKGGLGWQGKNSLLINPKQGSFYFLAVMALDLELEYDRPIKDYCGTCTRCMDACPTNAIVGEGLVDARKCISYLTIELKNQIPEGFKNKMEGWAFGCDICQDVCPWNRFSKENSDQSFVPSEDLVVNWKNEWQDMSKDVFARVFRKSAVKRAKYEGFVRNLKFVKI